MTATQTEIQSQAIDLSAKAFETFCDDVSAMFGVSMKCDQQEIYTETIDGLKKHFQELAAVTLIEAKGALNGTFQLIFDQQGLFILGNLMIMPERMASLIEKAVGSQKIAENMKSGSLKEAKEMSDAITEAGNIMVGSWDRVFREELDKHEHFKQASTFIGNPWDNSEEDVGLAPDEELPFALYKMTAGPYPPFTCGAIFPKAIFSDAETEARIRAEARAKVLAEAKEKARAEAEEKAKAEPSEADTRARIQAEEEAKVEAEMKAEAEEKARTEAEEKVDAGVEEKPNVDVEEKIVPTDDMDESTERVAGAVSETIQKMARSAAVLPGESDHLSLAICAKDIMQKDVAWASADDSVQQALTKMQQAEARYILVGTDGQLEGIVSKSDIAGAVSIYLRPIFAKWRRPVDDATLQIRIKWIMTSPAHTIMPETSLTQIMDNIYRLGRHALPVVDQHGKVQGLVTIFDICQILLSRSLNISYIGKTPQAPPLAQSGLLAGMEA